MRLAFDLETDGLLPQLTKIHCMSVVDVDSKDQPDLYVGPEVAEGVERLAKADLLTAHNGLGFDWRVIERFYPGAIDKDRIWDTLTMARLREPWRRAQRLKDWGKELKVMKGDYSGSWETYNTEMGTYCIQDAEVQRALFNHLEPLLRSWDPMCIRNEHETAYILSLQEEHGFRLDTAAAQELDGILAKEEHELIRDLQDVFPAKWTKVSSFIPKRGNKTMGYVEGCKLSRVEFTDFNPGSPIQVAERLQMLGWKPRTFTSTGQPTVTEEVLGYLKYPEVKPLIRWKNIDKQRGQIAGWFKAEKNGYVHGRVNTNGAYTGRMTHSSPNMANINKRDKRMRAVWLPDEGDKLLGIDADGLELRFLAHYLAPYDKKGTYAKAVVDGNKEDGTDAHSLLKRALNLYSRDSAKSFIYALIYGAGNPKLGKIIFEDARMAGKRLVGQKGASVGASARTNTSRGIPGLGTLTEEIKRQHKKRGWVWGLDGRKLKTQSEHSCLNTLIQGAGAVLMKTAICILFKNAEAAGLEYRTDHTSRPGSWAFVANVHDEWQMTAHPDCVEALAKIGCEAIRIAGEVLNLTVPMAGTAAIGDTWAETH